MHASRSDLAKNLRRFIVPGLHCQPVPGRVTLLTMLVTLSCKALSRPGRYSAIFHALPMEHMLPRTAFLTLCLFVSLTMMHVHAQTCTPLTTWPGEEIFLPVPYQEDLPGSGIQDTACVGVPFSTVFQLRIPDQFTSGPSTVQVTSASMATTGGMLNLPAGMTYGCNPPNCIFPATAISCIEVYGTAEPGSEGVADLRFTMLVQSNFPGILPITFPDQSTLFGNFFLHVQPAGAPACLTTGVLPTVPTSWGVFPNPTTGIIRFPERVVQAEVFDGSGRSVMDPVVSTAAVDLAPLPSGFYLVKVRTAQHVHVTRVWKE